MRKPRRPPLDSLLLKSRADRIRTRRRIPRSYRDLTRGAVALTLVINAILDIAAYTLDVVAAARITVVIFHYKSTFTFPPHGAESRGGKNFEAFSADGSLRSTRFDYSLGAHFN